MLRPCAESRDASWMPPLWAASYISFNFNMIQKLQQKFPNFQASFSCQDILFCHRFLISFLCLLFLSLLHFFCQSFFFLFFFLSFRPKTLGSHRSPPWASRPSRPTRPSRSRSTRRASPRAGLRLQLRSAPRSRRPRAMKYNEVQRTCNMKYIFF